MLKLDPIPKVITFDCYGTLVQWHDAVRRAVRAILSRRLRGNETDEQVTALADRLREAAVERQQRSPFCNYKAVLQSSLNEVLRDAGYSATSDDQETLLSILRWIAPHPEVPAALARLRERYRLAVISNTDDELITGTIAAIGTPLDYVVTAQQARAYKPDHQLFLHAYAVMGVTKDETIHVGMGQFTDLKVCHELGIGSVWIDRIGEPLNPDWVPDVVLDDLSGLPELLLPS
ncbi:HAD family hydrolase [Lichenifustis flavocetrariae]|uniref:HAD hydrolase-like protein n=1 Tax=Lichenifustis flavocetrariae TaxID=2949735 RepID=A0AA41YQJ3_9HYPH|nr:HAD family hydrolase [Lichenifustis flavocetrariae]MCW6506719.1 HAD hydrolase-like protein [Lichenifustis flavocetrariae]